jgi:hypothetical protein
MENTRSPLRLFRVLIITSLLILAAYVVIPDEPSAQPQPPPVAVKNVASGDH